MCYNPVDIIHYLKNKLNSINTNTTTHIEFVPYYEGFQGTIAKISDCKYVIKGKYEKVGTDKIKVTELPVGFWTDDFKELLESLIDPGVDKDGKKLPCVVKDYEDMSKDVNVDFTISFQKGKLEELENAKHEHDCNGVDKLLKLVTTNTTTNMHLFDANDKLKKYENVCEIIDDYYVTRLELYEKRKQHMIDQLEYDLIVLSNKARFIQENLDDTIDLRKKKKEEVIKMLEKKGYDLLEDDDEYKYLTKMSMDSVTEENVKKLFEEKEKMEKELEQTKQTTKYQMWLRELDALESQYMEYKEERTKLMNGGGEKEKPKKKMASTTTNKKVVLKIEK